MRRGDGIIWPHGEEDVPTGVFCLTLTAGGDWEGRWCTKIIGSMASLPPSLSHGSSKLALHRTL